MQKKLLVSVASIISIITATTTLAWTFDSSEEERLLNDEVKRLMDELKIDSLEALRKIARRNQELLRKAEEARRIEELEHLDKILQTERSLFAWKRGGYSAWAERPSEKVEAEGAAMAGFDCMFLAVRGGAELAGDVERLFAYAQERAKQALPYTDSPYAFTPYKHPGTISEDFWIGTLFSDARARIDRLVGDDSWFSSKAGDEFDRRNCRFMGKP